jgi:Tfp pilus assembly protein PilN
MNLSVSAWWDRISAGFLAGAGSLGVFLDESGLTLAHVQQTLSGLEVKHFRHLPVEPDGLGALGPRLAETVAPWGLESCPVSLAVSREMGFLNGAALPRAAAENLAQVVAYELDRFMPLPAERLFFDFQVLGETETEIKLLLMALLREPVEACLQLLAPIGLGPVSLELAPAAAANAFALLAGGLPESWLLVHLKPGSLEFTEIRDRTIRGWRRRPLQAPRDLEKALREEIQHTEGANGNLGAVCLYGHPLPSPAAGALMNLGQVAVIAADALPFMGLAPEADLATAVPAVGAALRGLGKVPLGGNLLPAEERGAVNFGGLPFLKILVVVFLALSSLWAGSLLIHRRVILYQVNSQIEQLTPEIRQVEKQLEETRALARQLQSFRKLEQSPDKLRILKELTQVVPTNTWLFNLRLSQQTLEISGMSRSAADLIPKLEKSGWLDKTEFTSPIVTDANKNEHFKIKAEIKGLELGS